MVCNAAENLQLQMLPLPLLNVFTFNFAILQYIFLFHPWLEHRRCFLTTSLVFGQAERRFHGQVLNCQPLRLVWVRLHYHPVVRVILDQYFFTSRHELLLFSYLAPQMTFERSKPIRNRIVKLNLLYMTIHTPKFSCEGFQTEEPVNILVFIFGEVMKYKSINHVHKKHFTSFEVHERCGPSKYNIRMLGVQSESQSPCVIV